MNYKISLFLPIILVLGAANVFPQNSAPTLTNNSLNQSEIYTVGEVRGNIKRKAVNLPKPIYPREALEAGADGIVKVEITIDAEGNVVTANLISGHLLLKNVAEETARQTKFKSIETGDPNARETGIITYSFAIEKASWLRIGYDLQVVQNAVPLRPFNIPRIARTFAPDWTGELEMLGKLGEMRRVEIETQGDTIPNDRPAFVRKTETTSNSSTQTVKGTIMLPILNPPSRERITLSQNLIAALQSRLANDQPSLWRFNLGLNLINAINVYRNPNTRTDAVVILQQFVDTAPTDVPAESLAALKDLTLLFGKPARMMEKSDEIGRLLPILLRTK